MISPTLARWRWAYLGSAMLKPAKSLIATARSHRATSGSQTSFLHRLWKRVEEGDPEASSQSVLLESVWSSVRPGTTDGFPLSHIFR